MAQSNGQRTYKPALWAIKALRDEPLPLFAAACVRQAKTVQEFCEPAPQSDACFIKVYPAETANEALG